MACQRGSSNGTAKVAGWTDPKVIAKFPGARVEGAVFRHPFLERDSAGVLADYVTLDTGTGLQAGIAIVILAIVIDRISQAYGLTRRQRIALKQRQTNEQTLK